ncbi:dual specificity protein phosphatase PHS1-like [Lotus japonicus]|uniref:dual specificity protein phosphatase PHS1-like n=1 Tax=Lotus japonicus TaxID=34305 RepID=UPI00258EBA6A|nr:dual specificity protein phosphatase PHS1-like [Lotus japonicus]
MAKDPSASIINNSSQHQNQNQGKGEVKQLELENEEVETPLHLSVTSRALYMLGDITAGPALMFTQWLHLVRKRTSNYRPSGFPHRLSTMPSCVVESAEDAEIDQPPEQTEISLWERLGKAEMLDIESSSFSWDRLSSLHHTEHTCGSEHSEDEMNRALEVTVNSGGVVFFAFFNVLGTGSDDAFPKEAAAVIKISPSRMATQSERLGYEFAKWLGVQTPQARVIHNTSSEWLQIKKAAEKARDTASCEGAEIGEMSCSELLEALDLSRCLLFMSYVHGSPLLESSSAFETQDSAERISAALGRVMMLDLVIRNEDRLPCRQLRWRGNSANLLLAEKMISPKTDTLGEAFNSANKQYGPRVIRELKKERRSTSVDGRLSSHNLGRVLSQGSYHSETIESSTSTDMSLNSQTSGESSFTDFNIVAIDSVVPRRPPAGIRVNDQVNYPKLVELLLNSSEFSSNLLHDITGGRLGCSPPEELNTTADVQASDVISVVHEFRSGFRAALRDLQGFHIFLLTLHQKLDNLLRSFNNIMSKISLGESDKEDSPVPDSPSPTSAYGCHSPTSKERLSNDRHQDFSDSESQRTAPRASSSSGNRDCCDSASSVSREGWHGKFSKGSGEPLHGHRFTAKLRDFHKIAKVDAESSKELEQWNEMLKNDAIKLCQENNFNTGFFEGSDNNTVSDACELKVRLEHILERIALISEAANTERPSAVTNSLFIGGALAARSVYTLQHLGITHILCLCTNEIGQSDSQFPDLFTYKNFFIYDNVDSNISSIFDEACDFIDYVEQIGQRVLVHCFEGKSRSVTLVLAHQMLRKNFTLLEAWNALKRVHRRAQPNDGFAKVLLELDQKLHGKVSMEWQQRKPMMRICPICGKNAGISSSSLTLHLQKSHKRLSSGSVDSAMTMEIQKALSALKISRGGSVNPFQKQSHAMVDE